MNAASLFKNIVDVISRANRLLSSKKSIPSVDELKLQRLKTLGVEPGYKSVPPDRSFLLKHTPKIEDLPPRNIKDSFIEGLIPLSTRIELQNSYVTFLGQVRIGKLLEDMDLFAVHVGYQHLYAPKLPPGVPCPFILVTASLEQMKFTSFNRKHNEDIKLSGFVSWVGKSSMEVVVWLEQHTDGKWHKITRALFFLAARNATATKSVPINPLEPLNEYEKRILETGEQRKNKRAYLSTVDIYKELPTNEEQRLVHDLYVATRNTDYVSTDMSKFPRGLIPMEKCRVTNVIFCQPENRNFYNTIFGGFIMRHATELTWVLGFQFLRHRPHIHHLSCVEFLRSIPVSSLMHMKARIIYTHQNFLQIRVEVFSLDPVEGKSVASNTVYFTLRSKTPVVEVYPKSYHEAMLYIDGKRHLDQVLERSGSKDDVMDEYKTKLSE